MHARDTETACATIEPLLAAYALGEHDLAARALVEAHLPTCPDCRITLARYQAVARLLPLGAADATPRPELRSTVIDAIDAAAHDNQPTPARWRRNTRFQAPARLWSALGALALVALLVWNIALQQSLAAERAATRQQTTALAALLQTPDLERYSLVFDQPLPNAQARLTFAPDQHVAALAAEGLPALPANRVYQLWLRLDGKPTNGGTFVVDAAGNAMLLVQAAKPLSAYEAIGVTVEPRGGSSGPTTPRVMGCKLT